MIKNYRNTSVFIYNINHLSLNIDYQRKPIYSNDSNYLQNKIFIPLYNISTDSTFLLFIYIQQTIKNPTQHYQFSNVSENLNTHKTLQKANPRKKRIQRQHIKQIHHPRINKQFIRRNI